MRKPFEAAAGKEAGASAMAAELLGEAAVLVLAAASARTWVVAARLSAWRCLRSGRGCRLRHARLLCTLVGHLLSESAETGQGVIVEPFPTRTQPA